MQDLKTYLSTVPVLAILCINFLADLLIEIKPFFNFFLPLKPREKKLC